MQAKLQIDSSLVRVVLLVQATAVLCAADPASSQPSTVLDLAAESVDSGMVRRVLGSTGTGQFGVPVAGGVDVDDDGFVDYAVAYMTAAPLGRTRAGEVDLVLGDGTSRGVVDSAIDQERLLRIYGDQVQETAGSEIWMDDVTGDGVGDLLICRQNFTPAAGRSGAGALTILVGGSEVRTFAQSLAPLDLRTPPPGLTLTHVVGAAEGDRLCIWLRTGDVTGDGIADVVVGADQEDGAGETHRGGVYVVQGGAHLAAGGSFDLSNLAAPEVAGRVAHIVPPVGSTEFHLGATVQVGDLDGNGVGEVMAAAALNRAGASLGPLGGPSPHAGGGSLDGTLYILWDDNFETPWDPVYEFMVSSSPGSRTIIHGAASNVSFGEEILGGLDFDAEGTADLFVGDLVADFSGSRPFSGMGNVLYQAAGLKGLEFSMNSPPLSVSFSTLLGPNTNAIGGDTAAHGDFNGDGVADLAFCSPHAMPQGRKDAGAVHVLLGQAGGWPSSIDVASLPSPEIVRIVEIQGAQGDVSGDQGDVLCYSAAAGDVNGDGVSELFVNEMQGNGSSLNDVGNLLVLNLMMPLFGDAFESGDTTAWSSSSGN